MVMITIPRRQAIVVWVQVQIIYLRGAESPYRGSEAGKKR
jgi:hypothetical protein